MSQSQSQSQTERKYFWADIHTLYVTINRVWKTAMLDEETQAYEVR